MRLATIKLHGAEIAGIVTGKGILPVAALNAYKGTGWKEDMMSLIQANHIPGLTKWYNEGGKEDRKSTRLNSSHRSLSRMPSSA